MQRSLSSGLFDCANGVYANETTYASFSAVNNTPPVTNSQLDTTNLAYTPGGPNCIVSVQLFYKWPIYVSLLDDNLSHLSGNYRLLVAASVFRNEPYGRPHAETLFARAHFPLRARPPRFSPSNSPSLRQ